MLSTRSHKAPGPAAVGVVRLSGPAALRIAARIFRPSSGRAWAAESHTVTHGSAVEPGEGEGEGGPSTSSSSTSSSSPPPPPTAAVVDEVLALAFRGPRSYTREDVVELHTHGGPLCAPRVAAAAMAAGARAARPGEFTLRAFLSGRLDLAQAEAVADLVTARTPAAVDSALAGLGVGGSGSGGGGGQSVGARIAAARAEALTLLAQVSAALDFDEGDAPDLAGEEASAALRPLLAAVDAALETRRYGSLLRAGVQVAIVGAPNVGKSSLLNALVGADRAIVAPVPGTTRDVVEAGAAMGGVAVTLLDTAGVRVDAEAGAEADGVRRSAAAAGAADVLALVFDGAAGWGAGDEAALAALAPDSRGLAGLPPTVLVSNKADLPAPSPSSRPPPPPPPPAVSAAAASVVTVSAATGAGMADLRAALAAAAAGPGVTVGGRGGTVNARQADALTRARAGLLAALGDAAAGAPSDCWSLGVREAVTALGEVSGDDATEEVLDAVFSQFCVGK